MAGKLKKVFFFPKCTQWGSRFAAWGSSFAGMGFELCWQGVRVLQNWNPMPAKREPHWVHFSAIFEHSGPRKLYQTSSLSVTRHMKHIHIFSERSL